MLIKVARPSIFFIYLYKWGCVHKKIFLYAVTSSNSSMECTSDHIATQMPSGLTSLSTPWLVPALVTLLASLPSLAWSLPHSLSNLSQMHPNSLRRVPASLIARGTNFELLSFLFKVLCYLAPPGNGSIHLPLLFSCILWSSRISLPESTLHAIWPPNLWLHFDFLLANPWPPPLSGISLPILQFWT